MKSSNPIWTIIKILLKIHLVIAGINTLFAYREERFEKGDLENGHIYRWKQGKIYYHRRGTGSPVLLIHGLDASDSGRDLDTLSKALSTKHTVYTIDLLGFGLSDKPWITYTNYLYVLLIQDFIKDVIGDITDVTFNLCSNRITFINTNPRISTQLLHTQRNTATFWTKFDNLNLDFLTNL